MDAYAPQGCSTAAAVPGVRARAASLVTLARAARRHRASPARRRPASFTSACGAFPRVSTRRTRRRRPSSWRCACSTRALVAFGERGDIEPALATAWTVSRDGLVWTFRLRQDVQLHDGTPLGPDEVVATLAERISADEPPAGAPRLGPALPRRGAGRPGGATRRGRVGPDRRGAAVRAAARAPGPSRPRDRRRAARRLAGRERTLPGRRAHPRSARAGSRADLARGPAPERPPDPARGRGRRGRSRRARSRRPPPCGAARRPPGLGRGGPPGRVRPDLAGRTPGAPDRPGPHQPQDGAPGRGARPRSRAPPPGARAVGGAARRLAAARRVGGARRRPPRSSTPRARGASWLRSPRSTRR